MKYLNTKNRITRIVCSVGVASVGTAVMWLTVGAPVRAIDQGQLQSQLSQSHLSQSQLSLHSQTPSQALPTPPDQGAPSGRQRGGATRGDCLAYHDLTALVPMVDGVVWSQTASDAPSFFFSLPAPLTAEVPVEFVIQDSDDNYVFRQEMAVEAAAGIVEIALPAGKANLTPGESYAWTLAIYCDATRPSSSVSVTGLLNRVNRSPSSLANSQASLETTLDSLVPAEVSSVVEQYATSGLWHEAIQLAFELYQVAPDNAEYAAPLDALLAPAGLADVPVSLPFSLPLLAQTTTTTTDL